MRMIILRIEDNGSQNLTAVNYPQNISLALQDITAAMQFLLANRQNIECPKLEQPSLAKSQIINQALDMLNSAKILPNEGI